MVVFWVQLHAVYWVINVIECTTAFCCKDIIYADCICSKNRKQTHSVECFRHAVGTIRIDIKYEMSVNYRLLAYKNNSDCVLSPTSVA